MAEKYIESIIIRRDNSPETEIPSFADDDLDEEFKFDGRLILKQIVKSVQNKYHNRHDYVFQIKSIKDLERI